VKSYYRQLTMHMSRLIKGLRGGGDCDFVLCVYGVHTESIGLHEVKIQLAGHYSQTLYQLVVRRMLSSSVKVECTWGDQSHNVLAIGPMPICKVFNHPQKYLNMFDVSSLRFVVNKTKLPNETILTGYHAQVGRSQS
jgi:hypothetical protein